MHGSVRGVHAAAAAYGSRYFPLLIIMCQAAGHVVSGCSPCPSPLAVAAAQHTGSESCIR